MILYHKPYSRREKTSQANEMSVFTSVMERKRNETTSSAAANGYGGTSKQGVTLLGEERLSPREDVKLSLTAQ